MLNVFCSDVFLKNFNVSTEIFPEFYLYSCIYKDSIISVIWLLILSFPLKAFAEFSLTEKLLPFFGKKKGKESRYPCWTWTSNMMQVLKKANAILKYINRSIRLASQVPIVPSCGVLVNSCFKLCATVPQGKGEIGPSSEKGYQDSERSRNS